MRLEFRMGPARPGGSRRRAPATCCCALLALIVVWSDPAAGWSARARAPAPERGSRAVRAAGAAATPRTHRITVARSAHGGILPSRPAPVPDGGEAKLAIFPCTGYHLDSLFVDSVPVRCTDVLVLSDVRAPHHVAATFVPNEYVILAEAGRHVSLTPSGIVPVPHGRSQTFLFSADAGFKVSEVLIDGTSVRARTRYTFSGVKAHHRIQVRTARHASTVIAPEPGELWRGGELREVRWQPRETEDADSAVVLLSYHGPDGPWEPIWRGLFRSGSAQWEVPQVDCDSLVACVATLADADHVTGSDGSLESWLVGRDYSRGLVRVRAAPDRDAASLFFVRAVPSPAPVGPVRLEYSVSIPGEAALEIYSVSGREVWRQELGYAVSGRRSAMWDGRWAGGGRADPGVYFARLSTRHGERNCRLVLLP